MDDHFHRRRSRNGIGNPDSYANELIEPSKRSGGVVVVDYHVRGMNRDFFPNYGPWLEGFVSRYIDSSTHFVTPVEIATMYRMHEAELTTRSATPAALNQLAYF
jgi:hypothetical protein